MNERKTSLEAVIAGRPALFCVREWRIGKPRGTVVCLHGLGVSGAEYAPMAEGLNWAGFDVLAPDWVGHGDSEYFGAPEAYEWGAYVQCLAAVVRRYHTPSIHYVGASWGGAVLLISLLARRFKPHSATFVDVPLRSTPHLAKHREVLERQSGTKYASIAEAHAFLASQRPEFSRVPERFREYFDNERYRAKENGEIVFKFDPAILPAYATNSTATFDYVAALERIHFNALFLYGASSPYRLPLEFMTICAKAPHLHYRDDMSGGHPPSLLHEDQFVRIIDFIKQTSLFR